MLFNSVIIDVEYLHAIFDGSHVVLYGQFPFLICMYNSFPSDNSWLYYSSICMGPSVVQGFGSFYDAPIL